MLGSKEREKGTTTTNDDDEKRGRGWKEFENFLRGGKIVALLAPRSQLTGDNPKVTSGAGYWRHEKQSSIAIAGRNRERETTVSPGPIPISQLDIRFIDIFSQSFERDFIYFCTTSSTSLSCTAAARATTRLVSNRTGRWSIRLEEDSRKNGGSTRRGTVFV